MEPNEAWLRHYTAMIRQSFCPDCGDTFIAPITEGQLAEAIKHGVFDSSAGEVNPFSVVVTWNDTSETPNQAIARLNDEVIAWMSEAGRG